MTIFFDYDQNSKLTNVTDLAFVSDSAIKANIAAWFNNNGNYDSAMEVIESGNNADIQSLMQCYAAGSTL